MKIWQSGDNNMGHWLCYDEPGLHFVEATTTDGKRNFFHLAFPGMVIYSPGMAGKLSSSWPWVALVNKCPVANDGSILADAEFYQVPLGHCYPNGGVCIYNRVPRPNIESILGEFWQSTSTYFVEDQAVSSYVHSKYKGMLKGAATNWSYFVKTDFFDDWEKNYTLDNIDTAPFLKFKIDPNKLRGSRHYPDIRTLAPWHEVTRDVIVENNKIDPDVIALQAKPLAQAEAEVELAPKPKRRTKAAAKTA